VKSENDIEAEIIGYLRERGWICRRQHVGVYSTPDGRRQAIGDRGECDWRCFRAHDGILAKYLELEVKAPGKKPTSAQMEYMAKRQAQGFVAVWADSLEMFRDKTGL
jgi:hypothetical protein